LEYAGKIERPTFQVLDGPGTKSIIPRTSHTISIHPARAGSAGMPISFCYRVNAHLLFKKRISKRSDATWGGPEFLVQRTDAKMVLHDYFKGRRRAGLGRWASNEGRDVAHHSVPLRSSSPNGLTGPLSIQHTAGNCCPPVHSHVIGHRYPSLRGKQTRNHAIPQEKQNGVCLDPLCTQGEQCRKKGT